MPSELSPRPERHPPQSRIGSGKTDEPGGRSDRWTAVTAGLVFLGGAAVVAWLLSTLFR